MAPVSLAVGLGLSYLRPSHDICQRSAPSGSRLGAEVASYGNYRCIQVYPLSTECRDGDVIHGIEDYIYCLWFPSSQFIIIIIIINKKPLNTATQILQITPYQIPYQQTLNTSKLDRTYNKLSPLQTSNKLNQHKTYNANHIKHTTTITMCLPFGRSQTRYSSGGGGMMGARPVKEVHHHHHGGGRMGGGMGGGRMGGGGMMGGMGGGRRMGGGMGGMMGGGRRMGGRRC